MDHELNGLLVQVHGQNTLVGHMRCDICVTHLNQLLCLLCCRRSLNPKTTKETSSEDTPDRKYMHAHVTYELVTCNSLLMN